MMVRADPNRPLGESVFGPALLPELGSGVVEGFVRATESGLYLPERFVAVETPSGHEWHYARGTWWDVYGETPTWEDIAERLSKYGLGQVLNALGGVSAVLSSYEPLAGQRKIFEALFRSPDRIGRDIQTWWDRMKREGLTDFPVFFSEHQILVVAKIALLVCQPVTQTRVRSLQPLGESLIMVSDLIDRETTDDLPTDLDAEEGRVPWLRFLLTNGLFNASDDISHALARASKLYLTDHSTLPNAENGVNLRDRFRDITGLEPDLALATGIALLARWRTVDRRAPGPPDPLNLEAYASSFKLTSDETAAVSNFFTVSADAATTELQKRGIGPDSLRPYDLHPLAATPLVRLEGNLYCPSVRLLHWKLTSGLHHVFLGDAENPEGARYLAFAGRVFEDYVDKLLRRVFPPDARRYIGEADLKRFAGRGKICDGAILYGDSVVLLESKATLFPYAVRERGDFDTLRRKIGDIFGKAAEQFDDTITAIEAGHLAPMIRPGQVSRYLPLVVTLDTLPITPFFYQVIEDEIARRGALAGRKARPLQAIAVSELELLEEYVSHGGSLADLLEERIRNHTYRDDCIKNYLLARDGHEALRPNRYLLGRYRALAKHSMEILKSRMQREWGAK
ncbi:hypothetical protein [Candidatus Palauibacter sp.]|uniref:hypothetical protein n=1 Tax=Candidatus Palauibacter sp. TaxID=3101350 RepID=UPI003B019854